MCIPQSVCPHCYQNFVYARVLEDHVKTVHLSPPTYYDLEHRPLPLSALLTAPTAEAAFEPPMNAITVPSSPEQLDYQPPPPPLLPILEKYDSPPTPDSVYFSETSEPMGSLQNGRYCCGRVQKVVQDSGTPRHPHEAATPREWPLLLHLRQDLLLQTGARVSPNGASGEQIVSPVQPPVLFHFQSERPYQTPLCERAADQLHLQYFATSTSKDPEKYWSPT